MMATEYVRELFDYRNGDLYWRKQVHPHQAMDMPAGRINPGGYRYIRHKGKAYMAHRLIWIWHGLNLPPKPMVLDHVNGDRLDNRMENLRPATIASNGHNSKLKADNKSGVRGVCWCNTYEKWVVQLYANKKKISGRFKDFDEAVKFANETRRKLHGEYFSDRVA